MVILLKKLSQIARYRIQLCASTEIAKQKVLHQLWATNVINIQKINKIQREIEENRIEFSNIVSKKRMEIHCYEFRKCRLIHNNNMALSQSMYSFW